MAIDIFLKIDGIEGESTDSAHKGEIEVASYSFGASNFVRSATGGAVAGKVSLQDFHFVMKSSKASPMLFTFCASGKHIDTAVLSVRSTGANPVDFLKYEFTDVAVSSYQTAAQGGTDSLPSDQISLNFGKIATTYTPQSDTGVIQEPVSASWNIVTNSTA